MKTLGWELDADGVGIVRMHPAVANNATAQYAFDQNSGTWVPETATDFVDLANSSAIPLGISGVFTGAWVNSLNYTQIQVLAYTDVNGAVGALDIQFSSDGINVDHSHKYDVHGVVGETVQTQTHAKFYRIVYTNGLVTQTAFRLQTILRTISASGTILEAGDIPSVYDDALLTKSIITGFSTVGNQYVSAKVTLDGGLVTNQNIIVDPLNSSTTNLAAGALFTGTPITDLNATAVQYILNTDQNCLVYIDQSPDGTNWDITDSYEHYATKGGSATTVQLVGSYYRIRVQNIGLVATTHFRLQTILVPFLAALPRSLDVDGNLQVAVKGQIDESGFASYLSPQGESIAVPLYRLIGEAFSDGILDTNLWTVSAGTGGVAASIDGMLTLSTGTTANNIVTGQTNRVARYVIGQANRCTITGRVGDTGTLNNTRRWGAFMATDGAYFELNGSGTTFKIVTRRNSINTSVTNGSFNGRYGGSYTLDTNMHKFEITYNTTHVFFFIDDVLIHTVHALTTTWSSTLNLPVRFENFNSNGGTTNCTMEMCAGAIAKMGTPTTQPRGFFQTGVTNTVVKVGPGNLHGLVLSSIANNAVVTLYDNTAASGTIIWSSGALVQNGLPFNIDMKGISFNLGLTVSVTGAATSVMVMIE